MTVDIRLQNIIDISKNSPQQRTSEWIQYRNIRVGGSEMYYICGLTHNNINTFINAFLYNKIDKKHIFIPPCEFGILFENEIHNYTEIKYNTIIYDIGVMQYNKIKSVCYSPDGVSIIDDKLVLFEFKCPYTRLPSNVIKQDYQCQINTGLHVIDNCNTCYYCEGEFKKCKLSDLYNYKSFDSTFHSNSINRDFHKLYTTYGILYIYELNTDINTDVNNTVKPIDIGGCNSYYFIQILNGLYTKKYKVLYFSDLLKDNKINKKFIEKYKNMFPYNNNKQLPNEDFIIQLQNIFEHNIKELNGTVKGYLPWKLYNYNTIIHEKKSGFFDDKITTRLIYIGYLLNYTQTIKSIDDKKKYKIKQKQNNINTLD